MEGQARTYLSHAIIAPMLSGKTTAVATCRALHDVDDARGFDWAAAHRVRLLLKEEMTRQDWIVHNREWHDLVRRWADHVRQKISPRSVFLVHDASAAIAAGAVVSGVVLVPENEFTRRLRGDSVRTITPRTAALARQNRREIVDYITRNPTIPVFPTIMSAFYHVIGLQLREDARERSGRDVVYS